jgi:hypothetical protein
VGTIADTNPKIETVTIAWGDECGLTTADVLRGPVTEREQPKRDLARELLVEILPGDGTEVRRSDIEAAAKVRDISWRTFERAKIEEGIHDKQIPEPGKRGAGPSWWFRPVNAPPPNGTPRPDTHEMADHSDGPQPALLLEPTGPECNGPPRTESQGVPLHDRARERCVEGLD